MIGVIVLVGEILGSQIEHDIGLVVIISAYNKTSQTALEIVWRISVPADKSDDAAQVLALIKGA